MSLRTRFAPTPSGFLHEGNAWNAIACWLAARAEGGTLRLRIDDLDADRVREECVEDVFASLGWLGLDWDEGPRSPAERAAHGQSGRRAVYAGTLDVLWASGRLYACTCSRKDLQALPAAPPPGACARGCRERGLPREHPDAAWRLDTRGLPEERWVDAWMGPVSLAPSAEGDPVLRRRDGLPAYHVASLTDDRDHGTTLLVRGADLLGATALQRALARVLDAQAPGRGWADFPRARALHHPLRTAADGRKLSKSAGDGSLRQRHERGEKPGSLFAAVAADLGLGPGPRDADGLLRAFRDAGAAWPEGHAHG